MRHDDAARKIQDFFPKALASSMEPPRFRMMTEEIARENFVNERELHQLEIGGLRRMISAAFTVGNTNEEQENRIARFCNAFGVAANDLGSEGMRLAKSQVLRKLDEGKFPENIHVDGVPLNLERDECAVWLFNNVDYYTMRNRTQYVGGSHGISIRVMKGVYYRVGSFRGEPIKTQYLSNEGRGVFLIGSRNTYFWSPIKAFKVPIKKILSVQPYSDGLQIIRDAANAVPQIFKLDDPLFACDAIARLSHL